mmetsp:Transcript_7929/g.17998  ORF Transcript_7929/g.17998 Transcript_7929/m.17998 type:complete len:237 (-) Transcript_7929:439-1149(-)
MHRTQLRDDLDGVQSRIFRQRVWHNLERLGISLDAVALHAKKLAAPLPKASANLNLRGASAGKEESLLNETADDAQRVMQRALSLVGDELVRPAHEHRRGASHVLDSGNLRHRASATERRFRDELGVTKLVRRELVDVRDGTTVERLGHKLDLVALDVLDHEDLRLGKVVQAELRRRVAEDGLLDEQHVAPARLDLLHQAEDVVALLLENAVHRGIVADNDVILEVGLRGGDAELD